MMEVGIAPRHDGACDGTESSETHGWLVVVERSM
jgi:hypothetical protein